VRGHVVGPFGRVGVGRIVLGHLAVEPSLQVTTGRRVGVILDQEGGRGVLHEDMTGTGSDPGLADHRGDLVRDLVEADAPGRNPQNLLPMDHSILPALRGTQSSL